MKYRIIRKKGFIVGYDYYPQYSENGKDWEYFSGWNREGVEYFPSLEKAKAFIEERKRDEYVDVVWESEE